MQAKRKLAALLLSLCMVLGVLPMTAFAAGVPAAPTNLKLELTETGLKASWDKPETTGELDIFEYEVTLYGHFDGIAGGKTKVETKTVQRETTCTFTTVSYTHLFLSSFSLVNTSLPYRIFPSSL